MIEDENSITNRLIQSANITEGMRVLDLGCGKGDVSLLLAKVVGSSGEVVGIDRNEKALSIARAQTEHLSNISFLSVDLSKPLPEMAHFDAIVGRRVLMYLPNPVDTLKKISQILKKNGIIAFQEIDSTISACRIAPLSLHEQVNKWIWRTIEKEGANINIGFSLPSFLQESGFLVDDIKAEANIQGHKSHSPLETVVRAIIPRIVHHEVATEQEIAIDTLGQRLKDERPDTSVFISGMSFSILGRKN